MLVKNGKAEFSLLTMGTYCGIHLVDFKILTSLFESYILIKQKNGEGGSLTRPKIVIKVNNYVAIDDNMRTIHNLLNNILKDNPIDLNAQVNAPVEYLRRRWTIFSNLNI